MPRIRKLHRMDLLRDSGFGRPPPRHGLNLLHWFANECISFNIYDQIICDYDPESSEYGFHVYQNEPDNNGVRLLPLSNQRYYIVGNLNHDRASELPWYVSDDHTGFLDGSNMDRIIVNWRFDQVYITQHRDRWDFDPNTTYRISWSLLKKIRQMSRDDFLDEMGYTHESEDDDYYGSEDDHLLEGNAGGERRAQRVEKSGSKSCCGCCTIL